MLMKINFPKTSSLLFPRLRQWPHLYILKFIHPLPAPTLALTVFYSVKLMLSPPFLIFSPRAIHSMFDSLMAKLHARSVPLQLLCLRRTSLSLRTSSPTVFFVNPYSALLILQIWITMQHFVKMGYTFTTVQTLCIIPLSLQTIRPGLFLSNVLAL